MRFRGSRRLQALLTGGAGERVPVLCQGSREWCRRQARAAGPTLGEQARQGFENLRRVLEAGGSGMDRVVNTTVSVGDMAQFAVVNELFAEYFAASPPARMTMQVPAAEGGCCFRLGAWRWWG